MMTRWFHTVGFVAAILLVGLPAPAEGQPLDLGTLGGVLSQAFDIDESGRVVGQSTDAAGDFGAFEWTPTDPTNLDPGMDGVADGSMVNLTPGEVGQQIAKATNDAGFIVGTRQQQPPFIRNPGGQFYDLPVLFDPEAIDESNHVVGSCPAFACVWVPDDASIVDVNPLDGVADGTLHQLKRLVDFGTQPFGQAFGINDLGWITGTSNDAGGENHLVLWHVNDPLTIHDLGVPVIAGATTNARGQGINNNNEIAGSYGCFPNGVCDPRHALLWTPDNPANPVQDLDGDNIADGTFLDLGTLGGIVSEALDLNDLTQVVGESTATAGGPSRPFIWDPGVGVMVDLLTFGGNRGFAFAIANNGLVVGDAHTASGERHAAIWDRPVQALIDVGIAGGGFSKKKNVRCRGTLPNCVENISLKVKNFSDRPIAIDWSIAATMGGPAPVLTGCSGVTGLLGPRKTTTVNCTATYSAAGAYELTASTTPAVGSDVNPGNNTAIMSVNVKP